MTLCHDLQDKAGRQSLLSGYGVQLSVKNTEYKAVDDTEVKGWIFSSSVFCSLVFTVNKVVVEKLLTARRPVK